MQLSSGTRLGPYEILTPLGAGGMGEVYRARDARLGRDVAIKALPPDVAHDTERLARFEREAKLLASLSHPNIAGIHGLEESGGAMYLILEFVEGETLAERLTRGALPVDDAIQVCAQVATAVEAAHEAGIIHRDLKPGNVMLKPDGTVKVLDFGLARADAGSASDPSLTSSPTITHMATSAGVILGTAAYMSPEQARGKSVDRRTDIWSFGCVFYECLTGRSLFGGETVSDVIARILEREPDWAALPENTPPRVRELLERCLRKDPKSRLRDIGDARLELAEAHAGAPGVEPSRPTPARASRAPWIAAVAVLAVALAASIVLRPRGNSNDTRTLRVSVALPPGLNISAEVPDAVPSPDGTKLVFSAADSTGISALYLRSLDASDVRRLPETEGVTIPFWSPDSRNIAFFAGGSLKRMAIDGNAAQILCPAPSPRGGAWGLGDVIVFNPNSSGRLMKIPASGGTPVPATTLDSTRAETAHRFPSFLPDGKHFLYVGLPGTNGKVDTRVGSLDDVAPGPLVLSSPNMATYAAPGYLLFDQQRSIVAQPFDAHSLELTGEPRVVPGVFNASASYSGSPVVMAATDGMLVQREAQSSDTRLDILDRTGRTVRVLRLPRGVYSEPSFSPDGKRLAVLYGRPDDQVGYVWLVDPARSISTRFTFSGLGDQYPRWTRDGKRIVWGSDRQGGRDLYWKNADGSGTEELLVDMTNLFNDPSSVTSDAVVFRSLNRDTNEDVWVAPLGGGGKPRPLLNTTFNEVDAAVSPDERWMAYRSDESGRFEIYVVAFPSMEKKVRVSVEGAQPVLYSTLNAVSWRNDGRELYFVGGDGRTLMAVSVETGETFHAGIPHVVCQLPREVIDAATAPDGQTIVVVTPASGNTRSVLNLFMNWSFELDRSH